MTIKLPKIGLGTMMINSQKGKEGLVKALEIGFRFLDTAQIYFNERTVGEAIKKAGVPREELIIATKLWVTNYKPHKVFKSTEKSLQNLGLKAIDILYLHWPFKINRLEETLKAMNKLILEGKIKHIGVSNYTPTLLEKALELSATPIIVNQVEMHPWLQQQELLAHHKKKGVGVVAYFPLMHGKVKEAPELRKIANHHGVSEARVALAWSIAKGAIPIPKSASPEHLRDNFAAQELKLRKEDLQLIDSIQKQKRFVKPPIISPKWGY